MNQKIYIALFFATVITMIGLGIIDPILPLYAKSMKATGVQLGIIFGSFALSRSLFAPFIGQYSDRHGRKSLMIAGLVLFTVVSACFVYADSPLTLTLIRLLQGFAVVLVTPVAQAYIGDLPVNPCFILSSRCVFHLLWCLHSGNMQFVHPVHAPL